MEDEGNTELVFRVRQVPRWMLEVFHILGHLVVNTGKGDAALRPDISLVADRGHLAPEIDRLGKCCSVQPGWMGDGRKLIISGPARGLGDSFRRKAGHKENHRQEQTCSDDGNAPSDLIPR
ncbi:MAG: hypothetical protein WCR46_22855 [Deltaproteobacteria bacterium]